MVRVEWGRVSKESEGCRFGVRSTETRRRAWRLPASRVPGYSTVAGRVGPHMAMRRCAGSENERGGYTLLAPTTTSRRVEVSGHIMLH